MKDNKVNGWSGERVKEALEVLWKNSYCVIGDKLVRIKEGLRIGSRLSPIIAEIVMNEWERKVRLKGSDKLVFLVDMWTIAWGYGREHAGSWRSL
jgi:hypothetical protein